MISEEVEPPQDNKTDSQSPSFLSLPDEIAENCLARISKWNYPNLSLLSKRFLSLLSNPQLYDTRSQIGTTEPCLYFCLKRSKHETPNWFSLWMKPNETLTDYDGDDLIDDYSLVPVPSHPRSPPVPYQSTVAVGSEIYLIGAPYKATSRSSAVRILDCRSHTWRDGPNMMVARVSASAVLLDEKIYVTGGCRKDESVPWMEVFDVKSQAWSSLRSHGADELRNDPRFTINVLDGNIYAISEKKDYAYDPRIDTWQVVETHSSTIWIDEWCVIDNIMYCYSKSGYCMWFDSKSRDWREVKGLDFEHLRVPSSFSLAWGVLEMLNYGGQLFVVWVPKFEEYYNKRKRRIWCAKITLEKRHGCEIWGEMEWSNTVLTVPKSFQILSCVAISI